METAIIVSEWWSKVHDKNPWNGIGQNCHQQTGLAKLQHPFMWLCGTCWCSDHGPVFSLSSALWTPTTWIVAAIKDGGLHRVATIINELQFDEELSQSIALLAGRGNWLRWRRNRNFIMLIAPNGRLYELIMRYYRRLKIIREKDGDSPRKSEWIVI